MASITLKLEPTVNGSTSYYPGQLLSGTVELKLDSPTKVRGFYVQVFGSGKSDWKQSKWVLYRHQIVRYIGIENYVHSRTYLFGEYGGPIIELPAGTHNYKFFGQLPFHLPYSLKLTHGKISYHVKAVLDIPWKTDKNAEVAFTVFPHDDLNLYPELKSALRYKTSKCFTPPTHESNLFHMTGTIPYRGFATNDYAPVYIHYENNSSKDIIGTKIKLCQTMVFNSPLQSKKKVKEIVVNEARFEGIPAKSSKTIQAEIQIPYVMTTNEQFSQVVIIRYFIEVVAETRVDDNPKLKFHVVIGSVPIKI
ncbi:arrestin domain-containing protein 2-like [Chironomus tepperi]|uniref:arrestin domain-containing protein 2-like n=1 Tax=Chironomus tepperi TaxID=113505 RepID=UPI00391F8AD8